MPSFFTSLHCGHCITPGVQAEQPSSRHRGVHLARHGPSPGGGVAASFTKQGGGVAASFTKHHHGSDCLFQPIAEDEADIGQTSGARAKIMEVSYH